MNEDDDYDNYSGDEEGFNEDSLSNQDYDLLHDLLPKVKKELVTYNKDIDEQSIKEALYYNYFELDEALKELRSKFPKKKGTSIHILSRNSPFTDYSRRFHTLRSRLLIPQMKNPVNCRSLRY